MKVLLNAEEFGFGPSAAIASIFKNLKSIPQITQLDYLGNGHSFDLQKKLDYDHFIHIHNEKEFKEKVIHYDWFVTAMDFEKAQWAIDCNIKTIIFDALFWYWNKIPPVVSKASLYVAQDFFGVKERIEKNHYTNIKVIPPNIQRHVIKKTTHKKDLILINFGGLENPFWDISVTLQYIQKILTAILPLLKNENVKIVTSKKNSDYVNQNLHSELQSILSHVSFDEMQELLQKAKFIIATPGLGNIYEIAHYGIPHLFLPPANDSQAKQLALLTQLGYIQNAVTWEALGYPVDYKQTQREILNQMNFAIHQVQHNTLQDNIKDKLFLDTTTFMENMLQQFEPKKSGNSSLCLADIVAETILKGLL